MTIEKLQEAITNIEESITTSYNTLTRPKLSINSLASILENYKELLKYKQETIGLSPVKVGDILYGVFEDEYLSEDDYVECYPVESIVVTKDGVLFRYDSFDGTICDLTSLLNGKPYGGRRIFVDRKTAANELLSARRRLGFEKNLT